MYDEIQRTIICRLSDILKRHMETNHRERIFNCVQCKKSFDSAGHLNQHGFTHSGEKVHICSECEKSFGPAGTLQTHMLTHSGEKTHTCSECKKSFGQVGDLKGHMITHSKACVQCQKSQMRRMWRFLWSSWRSEKALANPQLGKATQVLTMRLCNCTNRLS